MTRHILVLALVAGAFACGGAPQPTPSTATTTPTSAPSATTAAPSATADPPATPGTATAPATPPATPAKSVTPGYVREVHGVTQLAFELPTSWKREAKGDVMVITTDGAGVELVAATGGIEAKNDEKAMLEAVGKSLKNARFTSKMKPVKQNGLTGFVATGKGEKNGMQVDWFTAALGDGHGHAILALGMYRPDISQEIKAQIVHVLDSIQPAQ
jgi:hypothetical protein